MPLGGTFYGTTDNDSIQPKIVWKATQSVTGNYSTVTATLYYSRTNSGYTTKGTGSFSLTINGNKASASKYVTLTYNSNTLAITHKVQVSHVADGTKTITISATGSISGTSLGSTTISSTVTLDPIPRATTPTLSSSSVNMGSSVIISTPRASSSFTHDLAYKFAGSDWIDISTGVGTSYTWTVPNLSGSIPDTTSGTLSIRCITNNGSTTIGTKTVSMTVKVPNTSTYSPTISSVTVTEATNGLADRFGVFISGKSKLNVTITASGTAGSDIVSYNTTFLGSTYKTSSFTTGVLSNKGTVSMVTTVTDSRGRTAKKTTSISVSEYYVPRITKLEAYRVDSALDPDPEGERVRVFYAYAMPALKGLSTKQGNTADAVLEYKKTTESKWETLSSFTELAIDSFANTGAIFSIDSQYDIRFTVTDYFGAKSSAFVILPSGQPIVDIKGNGKGIAFGKVAERDGVDFGWPVHGMSNILWDGNVESITKGRLMNADQFIILSERIDEQPTGAVFAWSSYTGTATENNNWHFFFVPKTHTERANDTGVFMANAYMGLRKYVYIGNVKVDKDGKVDETNGTLKTRVRGQINNDATGMSNGLPFDNSKYVLRYVVGV